MYWIAVHGLVAMYSVDLSRLFTTSPEYSAVEICSVQDQGVGEASTLVSYSVTQLMLPSQRAPKVYSAFRLAQKTLRTVEHKLMTIPEKTEGW